MKTIYKIICIFLIGNTFTIGSIASDLYSCEGFFFETSDLKYKVTAIEKDGGPRIRFSISVDSEKKYYLPLSCIPVSTAKNLHLYFITDFGKPPLPARECLGQFAKRPGDGMFSFEITPKTPLKTEIFLQQDYPRIYEMLKERPIYVLWSYETYVQEINPRGLEAAKKMPEKIYLAPVGGILKLNKLAPLTASKK